MARSPTGVWVLGQPEDAEKHSYVTAPDLPTWMAGPSSPVSSSGEHLCLFDFVEDTLSSYLLSRDAATKQVSLHRFDWRLGEWSRRAAPETVR